MIHSLRQSDTTIGTLRTSMLTNGGVEVYGMDNGVEKLLFKLSMAETRELARDLTNKGRGLPNVP